MEPTICIWDFHLTKDPAIFVPFAWKKKLHACKSLFHLLVKFSLIFLITKFNLMN